MKQHAGKTAILAGLAILVITATALATPGSGVNSALIASGRFVEINTQAKTGDWEGGIRTKGASDLQILENKIAPGGTFGWHSHPGPSMVIVKSGMATLYLADDPLCTPHVYGAGDGFVDPGGDVHVVRNEGSVELDVFVASLIPAGATRRVDQPDPGTCASSRLNGRGRQPR